MKWRKRIHERLKPYYIFLILFVLWYAASCLEIWNTYLLPPPWKVADTFCTMLKRGEIFSSIAVSLKRVLTGAGIAFLLAFLLGILAAYWPGRSEYLRHINNFMRNVPPLSLISLLILWFGIGEISKLIVIILASFFPMYLNISKGFQECDRKLMEVGQSLGFSGFKIFWKICLPYAREDILVGLRTGLGYSWRALIGAEMFAAASGLGYMIVYAQQMSRSDKVLIGIFLIGIIGCISDKLFSVLIKKVCVGGVKND
ncbi:MAG: ABC transporter permease [Lachnospiraceae bacterium]|jgi:sulfonate transport system permease protein